MINILMNTYNIQNSVYITELKNILSHAIKFVSFHSLSALMTSLQTKYGKHFTQKKRAYIVMGLKECFCNLILKKNNSHI